MPSSKTETAVHLPQNADQTRRLRNVTQDRKAAARLQDEAGSGQARAADSTSWSTEELLGTGIDEGGNPVPDPVTVGDGKRRRMERGEGDVYQAMRE